VTFRCVIGLSHWVVTMSYISNSWTSCCPQRVCEWQERHTWTCWLRRWMEVWHSPLSTASTDHAHTRHRSQSI